MIERKIMLGGNLFFYAVSKKELCKLLDYSIDNQINSIDTEYIYSYGNSEMIIGETIPQKKRKNWFIATKLGQTSIDNRSYQNSKKNIIKKVDASLKRLKTDYIDLYQLHHYDPKIDPLEIIETLNSIKKEGKILEYGLSNYNQKNLKNILAVNKSKILSIEIHSNIFKNKLDEYLIFKKKIKLITYGTLGRGLITQRFLKNNYVSFRLKRSLLVKKDLSSSFLIRLNLLSNFCKNYEGWNVERLALYFMLTNKNIFKVILGVRNLNQIKNLISENKQNIPKKDLRYLEKSLINCGSLNSKLGEI
jgi:aryl-alcohol dehydrogenase-like predicted oxidoreductase